MICELEKLLVPLNPCNLINCLRNSVIFIRVAGSNLTATVSLGLPAGLPIIDPSRNQDSVPGR